MDISLNSYFTNLSIIKSLVLTWDLFYKKAHRPNSQRFIFWGFCCCFAIFGFFWKFIKNMGQKMGSNKEEEDLKEKDEEVEKASTDQMVDRI